MTDDEFLADVTQQNCYDLTRGEFERLARLARIGSAVQPRPISEAANLKEMIFYMRPKIQGWAVGLAYRSVSDKFVNEIAGGWHNIKDARFFIPLSALPQPKKDETI